MGEARITDSQELEIEPIKYKSLLEQIKSLTECEPNLVANLANVSALLMQEMQKHWVGFYLVDSSDNNSLVLGPFQGPLACTRIPFNKGVCGTAWSKKEILNISNVHTFAGHIACSVATHSELVVPIFKGGAVVAVLDIDSTREDDFDENDVKGLKDLSEYLSSLF